MLVKRYMSGVYLDDDGRLTYKVARKWRRITLGNVGQWRACPRCAAIVEGSWGQKTHIREHQEIDELLERILNRTLGEPGENGYEWDEDPPKMVTALKLMQSRIIQVERQQEAEGMAPDLSVTA